jgi:hypothetical protein
VVAGTSNGAPALWRVTADSVVGQNLSGTMGGVVVDDLVCYPQWTAHGSVDVLAATSLGVYTYRTAFTPDPSLHSPFFGE